MSERNVTCIMAMPADTPPRVRELTTQIMCATQQGQPYDPDSCAMACILVAFAFLALIDDDRQRERIVRELSGLAAIFVDENREKAGEINAMADALEMSPAELMTRAEADGVAEKVEIPEPPTEH
jgi:hypothetical protein